MVPPAKTRPVLLLNTLTLEQTTSAALGPELIPATLLTDTQLSRFNLERPSAKNPAFPLPAATELLIVTLVLLSATKPALPLPSDRPWSIVASTVTAPPGLPTTPL